MTTLTVLYGTPEDPDAFDAHYRDVHVPLAQAIPDLLELRVTRIAGTIDGSPPPYHLVAELRFVDAATMTAAMASPEGRAAGADVATFATGGATLLVGETFDAG